MSSNRRDVENVTASDIPESELIDLVRHGDRAAFDRIMERHADALLSQSWRTGMSVSGGQEKLRYYVGANYQNFVGAVGVADTAIKLLRARGHLSIPDRFNRPNQQDMLSLQSNMTVAANERMDFVITAGTHMG